jgi:hypothetical protein
MNSMTLPEHPSQSIELWQLGLPPDGESSVQTAIMHGKLESLRDQTAMVGASAIVSQLQLAALKIRKSSLSLDTPPTDTTLSSPGETAHPRDGRQP